MKVIKADLVKPNYHEIKNVWAALLADYYNPDGSLSSKYTEDVNCPFCGSNEFEENFTINGFRHVRCNHCMVLYVNPRLKEFCLKKLYNDEYYSRIYNDSMISVFDIRKELIGKSKYNQIINYNDSKGRILDIGCGIGEVLSTFKDNNWECVGIEMNPSAINWVQKLGIKVFAGEFENYFDSDLFDCVMAWNVIEHIVNPNAFLSKALKHLKTGGLFVSEVPSGESLLIDYSKLTRKDPGRIIMGEQHIVFYTLNAYINLHERAGFRLIKLQTNGLDIETIFKINSQSVSQELITDLQTIVDHNNKGDLIRGFWQKL